MISCSSSPAIKVLRSFIRRSPAIHREFTADCFPVPVRKRERRKTCRSQGKRSPSPAGEAVRTAPESARDEIVAEAARAASPEAKKVLAAEAVKSAVDGDEHEVVAGAAGAASPEAKRAVVAEAVKTAPDLDKQDIAAAALSSLASQEAQQEVASQFLPSQDVANEIWLKVVDAFKWVLWAATLALIGAIFVALFNKEVDQALLQILLTVFTTVAGIFAGFIGGKALGSSTNRPTGR